MAALKIDMTIPLGAAWQGADKAAEAHTRKTGHATATVSTP